MCIHMQGIYSMVAAGVSQYCPPESISTVSVNVGDDGSKKMNGDGTTIGTNYSDGCVGTKNRCRRERS